ncbi:snRNA-activating protein complex subunit 3 isoform X2 [Anabrus simplex]|uniref:snRNA-activating protein complex subunit 3 isoform X2 n=1 Tax=Anabrus simplex TaxID=316456 RepID=UPI0034DD7884
MDAVYMSYARQWVSQPVNIKTYFSDFIEQLEGYRNPSKMKKKEDMYGILSIMQAGLTEDEFVELENYCCVEKLDVPNEPSRISVDSVKMRRGLFEEYKLPEKESCKLETVNSLRRPNKNEKARSYLKYTSTVWLNSPSDDTPDMTPSSEAILTIRVYEPFKYTTGAKFNKPFIHCMYEVAVRAKQTLDVFRDKIVCSSDLAVPGDVSENPDQEVAQTAWDIYKSGFLFIEDVFYNDLRDPRNIDYSAVIRNWAEGKKLGPFHVSDMSKTKFEDLTLRLGFPYVFQHQGRCEHLIIISDARWVTRGNDKVCIDPCYFCDKCFKSCNYKDGKKIGDFTAYRYYDRACII